MTKWWLANPQTDEEAKVYVPEKYLETYDRFRKGGFSIHDALHMVHSVMAMEVAVEAKYRRKGL